MVQSHIVDYSQIEALAAVLGESSTLTELEVRQGNTRLRLRRPAPTSRPRPKTKPANALPAVSGIASSGSTKTDSLPSVSSIETVTAAYVGIFHASRKAPVSVGDIVTENQVLGQIETMRLLNDCLATMSGRLQAILVMDGQPVEYGQPLFEIAPEVEL